MLTNKNFKEELGKSGFSVTLISGEGCANCLTMLAMIKDLEKRRNDIHVFYVEVSEENFEINEYYEVEAVPTILITYNGELISKVKGYQPQEIFDIYIDAKFEECSKK